MSIVDDDEDLDFLEPTPPLIVVPIVRGAVDGALEAPPPAAAAAAATVLGLAGRAAAADPDRC